MRCLQDTCDDGWVRARVLSDNTVTFFDRNETILTKRKFVVNSSNGDFHFENDKIWKRCSGKLSGVWWDIENEAKRSHVVAIGHISDSHIRFWGENISSVWHLGHGNLRDERIQFSAKSQDFKVKLRVSEKNGDLILVDSLNRHVFSRKSSRYLWPNRDIKKVHMIFMNHLDIGYTGTINDVLNEYIHAYFSQVEILGKSFENSTTNNFKYITHPWLMSLLFDCPCANSTSCLARSLNNTRASPLICPNITEVESFKEAVNQGYMYWHAFSFNSQLENMSPTLLRSGLKMAKAYDNEFNRTTRSVSIRDVIYVSRSVIPYLNEFDIQALSIGSNGANYPPQVPKLHQWKGDGNSSVIVMYHPYGYGGYSKSTCDGPGQCGDCAESPNVRQNLFIVRLGLSLSLSYIL